jgi:hypothetical protein
MIASKVINYSLPMSFNLDFTSSKLKVYERTSPFKNNNLLYINPIEDGRKFNIYSKIKSITINEVLSNIEYSTDVSSLIKTYTIDICLNHYKLLS